MQYTLGSLMRLGQILESDAAKLLVIGAFLVGGILLYKLIDAVQTMGTVRQQEMTRREVAAYVAEGSMTVEAAEKLLSRPDGSWETQVAEMLACGTIDTKEAERLLNSGGQARARETASVAAPAASPSTV